MEGIINVLKPPGMTSSDVVVWLRRLLKVKKIGHTGTLDPGVAGVLPICVGKGTRLAEFITNQGKEYRAEVTFGMTTDTQDAYGQVIHETSPRLSPDDVEGVLPQFRGEITQIPPMYSAVRKEGKHLYEYARQGISIDRDVRPVTIQRLCLDKWYAGNPPKAFLTIECSKGTYVRTLCHDLGQTLGCGAYMSYLVRVRSGSFKIQDSWTLEEIEKAAGEGSFAFLLPLTAGVDLPQVILPEFRIKAFKNGLPTRKEFVQGSWDENAPYVQVMDNENLLGIGVWREESLYPHKVF